MLALLIVFPNTSFTQENNEERMNEIMELQDQAKDLNILTKAWSAYKLGDYEAALSLSMPLAETGNSSAQVFIGLMYNQGHGIAQDRDEAVKWYTLASEQGHAPATWRLAMLYYHGSGVTQNYQKAADLYHSAAKQGDVYSQKALGVMYSKGFGVPKDNILAYSWFQIASDNGFKLATKYQNDIANKMTPEETALSHSMAKGCVNSNYTKCGWALSPADGSIEDNS